MKNRKREKENRQLLAGIWLLVAVGVITLIITATGRSDADKQIPFVVFAVCDLVLALLANAFRIRLNQMPRPEEITGMKFDRE